MFIAVKFTGLLSGLGQFQTIQSPLKMMKNDFYFMLKAPFVLEIFTFLSRRLGYVEKRLVKKAMVNFKTYNVKDWTAGRYSRHINQYLKK